MTQGFIGATADGMPTTLGRGGSDFTAALLGAALPAQPGGDLDRRGRPHDRRSPHRPARRARSRVASYEEAAELATFGAKVLHPATAVPLVRAGIPIVVLNSTRPSEPGTTDRALGRARAAGRLADPLDLLEARDHGHQRARAPDARRLRLPAGDVRGVRAPRGGGGRARERRGERVAHRRGPLPPRAGGAASSASWARSGSRSAGPSWRWSGIGLRHTPGLAARVFGAVQPTNVEVISQGASAINMTFVVREEDGPDVVRRLHAEFFGSC